MKDHSNFSDIPPIVTSPVSRVQPLNDEELETMELFNIQIDEETGELVLEDGELHQFYSSCETGVCLGGEKMLQVSIHCYRWYDIVSFSCNLRYP